MTMVTIILADDHPVVRRGLRTLLEAEPDFRVVGEAADGLEAAQLVERLRPDVLVLDLMMPGLGGLEVTRQASQRSPQTKVIILSMYMTEAYVAEALRQGVAGYIPKKSAPDEVVQAVRQVITGRRYLSPPLSEEILEIYMANQADETKQDLYESLTLREQEILHLSAEGHTSVEISRRLCISRRTVEMHRANLMRKLNLHNQTELVRYALRHGILPLDEEP